MAAQKVLDVLRENKIKYTVLRHKDYGEVKLAQDFARLSQIPIEQIAKSVLLKGKEGYVIAFLPVVDKVDMGVITRLSGINRLQVAPLEELYEVTGYERFATTAIGLDMPVVVHEGILKFDRIYVATGEAGEELGISPSDLAAITKAKVSNIAE
jgi:Cys-tRNA(Pro)/Cys-tRNA(Cys) deacylase